MAWLMACKFLFEKDLLSINVHLSGRGYQETRVMDEYMMLSQYRQAVSRETYRNRANSEEVPVRTYDEPGG